MPRFLRNISLVLSALCVFSARSFSLNYTTMSSGLFTQSTVVNAPFSDGGITQMPTASAPNFQNTNRLLNRRVSATRGHVYTPNTMANASAYSPISRRSHRVTSVGASTNSRSGSTGSYSGTRRGSDLTAGGASVRLGVANISRTLTTATAESSSSTSTSTPDNGLGTDKNDLSIGELPPSVPIGDGLYPLLILLFCYALYRLLKGELKDAAKKEHQKN